jgi:hypothetical protein
MCYNFVYMESEGSPGARSIFIEQIIKRTGNPTLHEAIHGIESSIKGVELNTVSFQDFTGLADYTRADKVMHDQPNNPLRQLEYALIGKPLENARTGLKATSRNMIGFSINKPIRRLPYKCQKKREKTCRALVQSYN